MCILRYAHLYEMASDYNSVHYSEIESITEYTKKKNFVNQLLSMHKFHILGISSLFQMNLGQRVTLLERWGKNSRKIINDQVYFDKFLSSTKIKWHFFLSKKKVTCMGHLDKQTWKVSSRVILPVKEVNYG